MPSTKGKEKVWEGVGQPDVQKPIRTHQEVPRGWVPPGSGWAKLNLDAGYSHDTGLPDIDVVVRDYQCKVILCMEVLENVASAEEEEALACLEGM
jgi:hypothetical protein